MKTTGIHKLAAGLALALLSAVPAAAQRPWHGVLTLDTPLRCTSGAGTKADVSGIGLPIEGGDCNIRRTTIPLTAVSVTTTDATTDGAFGTLKLYDFPAGGIVILSSHINVTTLAGAGGLTDTSAMVGSLGTVAAVAGDTLTGTEANILASTAGTLSSGAGAFRAYGTGTLTQFDGHTTAVDLILNVATVDAGTSADDTLAVTGSVVVVWLLEPDF